MKPDLYECQKCRGSLALNNLKSLIKCESCGKIYKYENGVLMLEQPKVRFKSGDKSYDENMSMVFKEATESSWIDALRHYDKIKKKFLGGKCDYATNLSRVDFKFLLPLNKSSSVLDIGGGHGIVTAALARTVNHVYTIEKIYEQAQFIAIRAKQEQLNNIFVACGGIDCRLPYKDNSFDIVILNGVFEWIGFETNFEGVLQNQKRMLNEVYRVLKKSGLVWLTTKNKYSIYMLLSRNNNNNHIRFVSILPNKLINIISLKIKRMEYLSSLRSVSGYIKLFLSESFEPYKIWAAFPNVRYPTEYVRYDCNKSFISPTNFSHSSNVMKLIHLLIPNFFRKYITESHAFILRKQAKYSNDKKSIIDRIISSVPKIKSGRLISMACPRSSSLSSSVLFYVNKGNETFLIKLTRFEDLKFLKKEIENCQFIRSNLHGFCDILPEFISSGFIDKFNYSVIKFYKGYSLSSNRIMRKIIKKIVKQRLLEQLKKFIWAVTFYTAQKNNFPFSKHVVKPIQKFCLQRDSEKLQKFAEECINILFVNWSNIPIIFEHCDMHFGNIIIEKITPLKFKLIDWESANKKGYPGVDLYSILRSLNIKPNIRKKLFQEYCRKFNIDFQVIRSLVFLRLIHKRENWKTKNCLDKTYEWSFREKLIDRRIDELMNDF